MVIIDYNYVLDQKVIFTGKVAYKDQNIFYKDNLIHRYYGPAIYNKFFLFKSWAFNSQYYGFDHKDYSQKQFLKDLNKQWLW